MTRLVTLVLIGCAAWLVALTASFVVELELTEVTRRADQSLPPVQPVAPWASLQGERIAALFGFRGPEIEVAQKLPSRFEARLIGTMIDLQRPGYSLAMIRTPGTLTVATYALGDLIAGAEVVAIDHSRVYVRDEGQLRVIETGDAVGVGLSKPTSILGSNGPIRQTSESTFELERTEVNHTVATFMSDPKRPTLTAVADHGVLNGMRLLFQPGTLYTKLGLQTGDIIRRVNRQDLQTLLATGQNLTETLIKGPVELEVERAGVMLQRTYTMR